jgi:hypothetical protein
MTTGWIDETNLKPFLETVAQFAGYELNNWDWDAINYGVKSSDHERGRWFIYEIEGVQSVTIRLAIDPGTAVLFVEIDSEPPVESKADVAIVIMQSYRLLPG